MTIELLWKYLKACWRLLCLSYPGSVQAACRGALDSTLSSPIPARASDSMKHSEMTAEGWGLENIASQPCHVPPLTGSPLPGI